MAARLQVLLGKRVRDLRREKRLTQQALADRTGLSLSMIGGIERGAKFPSPATFEKLARALGARPADLFDFEPRDYVDEPRRRALKDLETALKEETPDYIRMICRIVSEMKKSKPAKK